MASKIRTPEQAMDFLKKLMHEINAQDNRMTACPYFYVLKEPDVTDDEDPQKISRKNVFLTEKAAKQHIDENQHHYPEGTFPYLDHGWRNPELLDLLTAIGVLVGEEYILK